jgi:UDP-N-acetylglucosamine 2-epimerase (non-hydrolysing)
MIATSPKKIKVTAVFGTRPEAIKMAPVVKELQRFPEVIETRVAVTAQHRQMLDQVLELFHIVPDHDLNIMKDRQTLFDITAQSLQGLGRVFEEDRPDLVLVHGDTTTTFAGSLAAFYHQIPVGHVEAGLRTHNRYSPYPEEMNRHLTGVLSDLHFAPTATSRANLLREGVAPEKIFVTGNTVIDALLATVRSEYLFEEELARIMNREFSRPGVTSSIESSKGRLLLVTTHRRENLGEPLREVYLAFRDLLDDFSDIQIVFPVHKNPRVREVVEQVLGGLERVHLVEPMDYQPFTNLMNHSFLVLTDSGGLQEEAPALGKPVLVLRDTTERPEAVAAGTVKLVGTNREMVYETTRELLKNQTAYARMAQASNPYGDGQAARRTVLAIRRHFGLTEEPWMGFGE